MFIDHQKYSGTKYTMTVALLIVALVASPAALFVSRSTGYLSILTAVTFSILCGALAWMQWKEHSELTIPSIASQPKRTK